HVGPLAQPLCQHAVDRAAQSTHLLGKRHAHRTACEPQRLSTPHPPGPTERGLPLPVRTPVPMPLKHRLPLVIRLSGPVAAADRQPRESSPLPAPPRFEARVDDPMLAPMPPAEAQVGSWDEALGLVRQRSTDLRFAESQVTRARGQWRQALSGLLPNGSISGGVALDLLNPGNPVVSGGGSVGAIAGGGGSITPTTPLGSANASVNLALVDVSA